MKLVPAIFALLIAFIAAFLPAWPTYFPRLGVWALARTRPIRLALLLLAWMLGLLANASIWVLALLALFTLMAALLEPKRVFVSLFDPLHLPSEQANMPDHAWVIGYAEGEQAVAWPLEVALTRHLIHDRLGRRALLTTY